MKEKTEATKQCPEFPYFGATYPDAMCIDGLLYDLDNCDDNGNLYERNEDIPCPFCREKEYIKHNHDPLNGITKAKLKKHIEFLKGKYIS